jgi:hypothetical protein
MSLRRRFSDSIRSRFLEGGFFTFLQPRSETYWGLGVKAFDVEVGKQKNKQKTQAKKQAKKYVDIFNSML